MSEERYYTIIGAQYKTHQCPSCKKNVHCIAGYKNEGDPVELLKDRCSKDCECKCRTHYLAKNGKLKKYGTVDDTKPETIPDRKRDETDDLIDQINAGFLKDKNTLTKC